MGMVLKSVAGLMGGRGKLEVGGITTLVGSWEISGICVGASIKWAS